MPRNAQRIAGNAHKKYRFFFLIIIKIIIFPMVQSTFPFI